MTDLEKLQYLTEERDDTQAGEDCPDCRESASGRMFTDEELLQALALFEGDVYAAAYDILVKKALNTQSQLGDMTLPDQSAYYLRLARNVRRNVNHNAERADR